MLQRQPVRARASGGFSAPATAPLATRHPWSLPGAASPARLRFPRAEEPDLAPGLPRLPSTLFLVSTSGTPVSYVLVPSPKSHIFLARRSVSLSPKGTEASSCRESGGRRLPAQASSSELAAAAPRPRRQRCSLQPPLQPTQPALSTPPPSPPAAHSWAGGAGRDTNLSALHSHTHHRQFSTHPHLARDFPSLFLLLLKPVIILLVTKGWRGEMGCRTDKQLPGCPQKRGSRGP